MAFEIVRNEKGHFAPGHSGNPGGVLIRKRVERTIQQKVKKADVDEIATNMIAALKDPDAKPVAGRIAFDRFWPVVKQHELSGPDGGPLAISSAQLWADVADRAGREVIDVENLAQRETDPSPEPGAD